MTELNVLALALVLRTIAVCVTVVVAGYLAYYGKDGWYGNYCFLNDLKMGIITIIEDFKPKQEIKKYTIFHR